MSTPRKSISEADGETERGKDGEIEVLNRQRARAIDRVAVGRLVRAVLDRIGRQDATLTVTFIRDRAMHQLNREYRGLDKPTDVLSFAYQEVEDDAPPSPEEAGHLGDVVISVETAERYAGELGLTFERELEHLVIHGALHLAGYDHETDDGEMIHLERRLRRALLR